MIMSEGQPQDKLTPEHDYYAICPDVMYIPLEQHGAILHPVEHPFFLHPGFTLGIRITPAMIYVLMSCISLWNSMVLYTIVIERSGRTNSFIRAVLTAQK